MITYEVNRAELELVEKKLGDMKRRRVLITASGRMKKW